MLRSPNVHDVSPRQPHWVPDYRYALVMVVMIWAQLYYMIVPESFGAIGTPYGASTGLYRLIKLGLLGLAALLIAWRAGLAWLLLRTINPFLLGFVLLAGASTAWSIEPGVTVQRMIGVVSTLLVCIAFGLVSWRRTRFQDAVRPAVTALLLASILVALVSPDLGIEQGTTFTLAGSWRGVTFQKNALGHLASFGLVFWLHAWLARDAKLLPVLAGLAISVTALIGSRSSTSLLSGVFACIFLFLLLRSPQNLRRYMPFIIGAFAILVLTYALAVLKVVPGMDALLTPITALTGKDQTFSNRSVIWEIINEHIKLAPILGSGYGAYWTGPYPTSPSFVFLTKMYFYPTQAHNGYLETINDLGYVGLSFLLGFLFFYVRQALQLFRLDRAQGALFLGLFFLQAIANLSEANWFQATSFEWVIMMISTVALGRSLLEFRLRSYFGRPGERQPEPSATPRADPGIAWTGRMPGDVAERR